ncbi:MAG: hypothetical protein AB1805_03720 [Nitrospirota bacterium]
MKRWILMVMMVAILPSAGHAGGQKEYRSPDGRLRALVIDVGKDRTGLPESRIEIRKTNGALVFEKDYSSPDGSHGWVVASATWTPDSMFFVFGMYSSGGHQPWQNPVNFYSRRHKRVFSLNKYVGTITDPEVQVVAPDIVKVIARKKGRIEDTEVIASLSKLLKQKKR